MEETVNDNAAFFDPIIKITAATMLGTAGLTWGVHLIIMRSIKNEQADRVAQVQYRIDQIGAYADIYKKSGAKAANATLK